MECLNFQNRFRDSRNAFETLIYSILFLFFTIGLQISPSMAYPQSKRPSSAGQTQKAEGPQLIASNQPQMSSNNYLLASRRTPIHTTIAACGGGGNKPYHFSGKLQMRHDGDLVPLKGVQLRIVRPGSPLKWTQGPDVTTNSNGEYNVTCTFARDRNGIAPGGKKIRFKIMARFRDSEFKIRKAGWAKNNWYEVEQVNGCNRPGGVFTSGCKDNDFNNVAKIFDTDNAAGKQAYLWWFYNDLQDRLEQENIGITNRPIFKRNLTITYPEKSLIQPGSSFLFNVHLEKGDWDNKRTMIHEYMHRWDVGKLGGEGHISCLTDIHHKDPNRIRSSRCAGFMEGFAEASAAGLEQRFYGGNIDLYSHADLRAGNLGYEDPENNFKVANLNEAERSDVGWENFLKLIMTDGEIGHVDGTASCDPTDVKPVKMLQVLQADRSRKADWYKLLPNASFSWFTGILQDHISTFTAEDAEIYQRLGDPSRSASSVCEPANHANLSLEYGYNRGGSDYRNFAMDNPKPKLCREACAGEEKCEAFTYVPPGRQGPKARCWLKDSVPNRSQSDGLVSGVKGNDPIHEVTLEYGFNRGGSDYRNFRMNNPEPNRCREACATEGECKSFTYVPPGRQGPKARCWLKDSVPNRTQASDLVSGVKEE